MRHFTWPVAALSILACLPLGASATAASMAAPSVVPALRSTCGSAAKQAGAVRVVAFDETGAAVSGATVTAMEPYKGALLSSKMTAEDGSVVFPGMSETRALFVVALAGFHPASGEAYLPVACEGVLRIRLTVVSTATPILIGAPPQLPEAALRHALRNIPAHLRDHGAPPLVYLKEAGGDATALLKLLRSEFPNIRPLSECVAKGAGCATGVVVEVHIEDPRPDGSRYVGIDWSVPREQFGCGYSFHQDAAGWQIDGPGLCDAVLFTSPHPSASPADGVP